MVDRTVFGKLTPVLQPPNLIDIQTQSFRDFLQLDVHPRARKNQGLQAIFKEIFPIESYDRRFVLDFVEYTIGGNKDRELTPLDALYEGKTYARSLNVIFRLKDNETVTEESVYMGDIPLMTNDGAFVVNGAERVIVSQLHRSPGVSSESAQHPNGTTLHSIRVIPDRGSWLEIQFDTSDQMWVYMDRRRRRRKFLVTTFLRALGYSSDEEIVRIFYAVDEIGTTKKGYKKDALEKYVFLDEVHDPETKALLARAYEKVTEPILKQLNTAGIASVRVIDVSRDNGVLIETLKADVTTNEDEALRDIYHKLRPGDPATPSNAKQLLNRLFFDKKRYDLGRVGRYKLVKKLHHLQQIQNELDIDENEAMNLRTLCNSDVIEAINELLRIKNNISTVDDIDHLGNRRIRTAGELVENQCRVGLSRTERLIRERMQLLDPATTTPQLQKLVNSKSLSAVVQDFFGRSQLSQFMDMTNPLSALAHKRRLSALGPGGLSRDRAGFEVRDIHPSHYGRICPIETPEGPNIGLISSLGIYAKINDYGFLETPYRKVVNGKVTDEVVYLSADEEENFYIAQANAPLTPENTFVNKMVYGRYNKDFVQEEREKYQYMDISPMQMISIAAGLIPFLEHDDANRALMGANMMRQAVPLLRTERPFVATGLEGRAARDSKVVVEAREDGVVCYVDAHKIIVSPDGKMPRTKKELRDSCQVYELQKFRRTNAGTCFNQRPIVRVGDKVRKAKLDRSKSMIAGSATVLADGPATDCGELSLGKNLLVAFMPWRGYNFEDAIVISQRCVRDDTFTSVHIQEFECTARETKLGPEEITRDIPNVSEEALRKLDRRGIIRVGAEVGPGDILIGKITPKSETELAPEERLLRAIFGEKASDVRDTSLRVPSGTYGIVMDVRIPKPDETPRRSGGNSVVSIDVAMPSPGAVSSTQEPKKRTAKDVDDLFKKKRKQLVDDLTNALSNQLLGEKIPLDVRIASNGEIIIPAGKKITKACLVKLAENYNDIQMEASPVHDKISTIIKDYEVKFDNLDDQYDLERVKVADGDDGENSVIKCVRVYIAEKKNLSVGDKLSGRHGNKGVVARIVPDCDMPFLENGQPMDIVLNPLGVPSRMNLGQVFETHLGIACKALGMYAGTPVFDGVSEDDVHRMLAEGQKKPDFEWMNADGKTVLYDGYTGERFDQRIMVGAIYMLKLHHLVTDKIHARATGPYSLVTQQPLGGKAQYGGQRMGEMEVWALEAYGAAYALQEMLTVKSDDVAGRTRIYESICKGENVLQAGMPESFSVLQNELRGLCLDMKPKKTANKSASLDDVFSR